MSNKETYNKEINKVNKELNKLTNLVIEQLKQSSIEYIDLYQFISLRDTLTTKKQKLIYLSLMEDCKE